jgi:hypothetical protein
MIKHLLGEQEKWRADTMKTYVKWMAEQKADQERGEAERKSYENRMAERKTDQERGKAERKSYEEEIMAERKADQGRRGLKVMPMRR